MRVMACICQFVPRLSSSFAHVQCLHGGLASGSIWCQKAVGSENNRTGKVNFRYFYIEGGNIV